jgi:hypothetical protein
VAETRDQDALVTSGTKVPGSSLRPSGTNRTEAYFDAYGVSAQGFPVSGYGHLITSAESVVLSAKVAVTVSLDLGSDSRPLSAR